MDNKNDNRRDDIFSNAVRAGKRTYFFDVKATKGQDLYLTITESKKKPGKEGKMFFEKHKVFLYKEDFEKFKDGFEEALEKIEELKTNGQFPEIESNYQSSSDTCNASSKIEFEDLD